MKIAGKFLLAGTSLFLVLAAATVTFAAPPTPTSPSPGTTTSPGPVLTSSTVTLRWNASSGATTYGVGVRDLGTNVLVVDTNTSSTSFTANLSPGRLYRWNVNACNSTGCSTFTTPLHFQTPGSIPSMPSNTSPGSTSSPGPILGSSTVTLSWSTSSGATTYGVGVRDLGTNVLVVDTNTSNTSFTASLSPGRQYRWNVNACNGSGCSSFTTPLHFQTPASIPPMPSNTSPGSTSSPGPILGSSTVTLNWSPSSGATTYGVGVRDLGTNVLVVDTNTSNSSFTASLSPGRQYRWNVNACNGSGCSSFTTPLHFQTPASIPPTPTNTSPGSTSSPGPILGSSTVTMSWSSSGAATYGVAVRDLGTNVLVVDTNTSNTSFTANLSPGRQYRWNVNACNGSGCSSFTTPLHFQTPASIPPTPTNTSPGSTNSPGPILSSSTVTMSWSSSGATTYGVAVRDLGTNVLVVDTNTSNTSFTASLSPGRQYRWNVNACNGSGCSSFTTPLHFQTPGAGPSTFTLSNNSPICDTNPPAAPAVRLNWSQSSGATSYELHRNGALYVSGLSGLTFYNNLNVNAGQSYVYFVRARNSSGFTDSNSVTVNVPANICANASPPTISNINPSNVTVNKITVLTVNGTNFKQGFGASVTTSFGTFNIAAAGLTYINSNQVLVQVTMGGTPPLSATLRIINLDGLSATGNFQVVSQQQPPGSFSLSNQAPVCDTTTPIAPAVRLNWTASNNATSYDLHRNGSAYASGISGTTFYNSVNVVAGQTYTYFVRARNATGTTDSNTVAISVPINICGNSSPSPSISRITPGTVTVNQTTTLTILGSNFQNNFAVTVQGNAIDPSGLRFIDSGTVTASVRMGGTPPYAATLVLRNLSDGKTANGSFTVESSSSQNQAPSASFTHSPNSPNIGQTIQFTDTSTGSGLTRSWDFNGDGTVDSQAQNPTHSFPTAGPYEVTLRVTNAYGTDSATRTVMVATTSAGSPVVNDVLRKYAGFFLKGSGLDNVYDVKVDWKGSPGTVSFSVNGGPAVVRPGTATGASFTFNLDRDLPQRFSPSVITIIPRNGEGVTGSTVTRSIYVFPYPSWLEQTLGRNSSALNFTAGSGFINANLNFDFPNPHLAENGPIDIPTWVPYIGGKFGLNETYASVSGSFSSAGTGSVRVGGTTGFAAMGQSVAGSVSGSGNFLLNDRGLSLLSTSFNLNLTGSLRKEIGVVDAIPQLAGLQQTPGIGAPLRWFNEKAKLIGEVKPQLGFGANWQQNSAGALQFNSATGTLGLNLQGTLRVAPIDHIQASGWVAGGGSINLGVPSPFVRSLDLTFESGVRLKINYFFGSTELTKKAAFRCRWSPGSGTTCGREESLQSFLQDFSSIDIPLSLISPSFDQYGQYSNFRPVWHFKNSNSLVSPANAELSLVTNVFPAAAPQITQLGEGSLLMWVQQNPGLPVLQSTNISWSFNQGADSWTTPVAATNDTRAELYPVVAATTSGRAVAAWLRIKDTNFNTPIDSTSQLPLFHNRFDVVSSVFDSTTRQWSPVVSITDDAAFDNALRVSSDNTGNVLLTWLSNVGGEFTSTQANPSTLKYSFWNGSSWATPAALASNLIGVNVSVPAVSGNNAFIVVPRDPNPNTTSDGLLDLYKWNGTSWSAPTVFAAGGVENRLPSAVYSSNGEGHVVWLRDNDLVHATLTNPTPQIIRRGSTSMAFYNVRLVNNANGNLTLVWTEIVDNGPANIFAMVYDPATQTWSADRRLTENQSLAHDVSAYYGSDGKLNLAYLTTQITRTTKTVMIDGEILVIPNIPQEGRTDLQLLAHSLTTDLAVRDSDLVLNAPPSEGQAVSGTLTVRNAGDFTAGNFVVNLYAGEPAAGNILQSIVVADSLRAGESRPLAVNFTMPTGGSNIVALVDVNNSVSEFTELNNRATYYVNNRAPEARVTANVIGGQAALTVNFDASGSFDLEGDPITFTWAFADGTESTTGSAVTHIFNQAGTFPVTLTVTDSKGAVNVAVVNITVTPPPIEVFLDPIASEPNRAAAVDSVLLLRDPFPVVNSTNHLNRSADKNTRLIIFVGNLQLAPGTPASSVVVNLTDPNNRSYDIPAEDVRTVPNFGFTQITFRLPDNLPTGTSVLKVRANTQTSNIGTIKIRN